MESATPASVTPATAPLSFWEVPEEAPARNDPAFSGDSSVYRKEYNAWKSRESYRRNR